MTITLEQTTVKILRAKKGSETWDELMLRLIRRGRCGIECLICERWIETEDVHVSPSVLAEMSGWDEVATSGDVKLGYVCTHCMLEREVFEERKEQ